MWKILFEVISFLASLVALKFMWDWLKILCGFHTWKPSERLTNKATKSIKSFPSDLKLKDGDLCVENGNLAMVSQEDAFKQNLQCYVNTYVGECFFDREYGCEFIDSIFHVRNKEFKRQCEHFAKALIGHKTFKDYIEEIYEISRKKEHIFFGKPKLCIEFKVKGQADTFKVELSNINDLLKEWQKKRTKNETKV